MLLKGEGLSISTDGELVVSGNDTMPETQCWSLPRAGFTDSNSRTRPDETEPRTQGPCNFLGGFSICGIIREVIFLTRASVSHDKGDCSIQVTNTGLRTRRAVPISTDVSTFFLPIILPG